MLNSLRQAFYIYFRLFLKVHFYEISNSLLQAEVNSLAVTYTLSFAKPKFVWPQIYTDIYTDIKYMFQCSHSVFSYENVFQHLASNTDFLNFLQLSPNNKFLTHCHILLHFLFCANVLLLFQICTGLPTLGFLTHDSRMTLISTPLKLITFSLYPSSSSDTVCKASEK